MNRLFSVVVFFFMFVFSLQAQMRLYHREGLWEARGRGPWTLKESLIGQSLRPLNQFIKALRPDSIGVGMQKNLLYNLFVPFQEKIDSVRKLYAGQPDSLRMHVARLEYDRTRLLRIFLTEKQWQAYLNGVPREAERERRYQKALKEKGWIEALKDWEEEDKKIREQMNKTPENKENTRE